MVIYDRDGERPQHVVQYLKFLKLGKQQELRATQMPDSKSHYHAKSLPPHLRQEVKRTVNSTD